MSGVTTPLILSLKVRGEKDVKKLEKGMEGLERDLAKVNKQLPKTANNIRATGRAAGTATGNIQRMGIAFRSTVHGLPGA